MMNLAVVAYSHELPGEISNTSKKVKWIVTRVATVKHLTADVCSDEERKAKRNVRVWELLFCVERNVTIVSK